MQPDHIPSIWVHLFHLEVLLVWFTAAFWFFYPNAYLIHFLDISYIDLSIRRLLGLHCSMAVTMSVFYTWLLGQKDTPLNLFKMYQLTLLLNDIIVMMISLNIIRTMDNFTGALIQFCMTAMWAALRIAFLFTVHPTRPYKPQNAQV